MGSEEFAVVSYLREIIDRFLGHEIKCLEICTTSITTVDEGEEKPVPLPVNKATLTKDVLLLKHSGTGCRT